MPLTAFKQAHIYERQAAPKEKHKSIIQCLECYDRNVYMGTRDSLVQHLILSSSMNGELDAGLRKTREGRVRKLGSSNPVTQLRAVPVFNHLLVLWDRCVSALNMFSLEPIPALKKIQHVSSFEVCKSSLTAQSQAACVEMVTSSSRRKVIQIHMVGVDRWEAVREVSLPQDPVALAVDGASICVATSDRYLLCNSKSGNSVELCPHNHSRQNALVTSAGEGEFLLNGPGSLGMFVMKTGICQRPPLQWPEELLAAGVCFPYILTLQPQVLSVYSMLDQKLKQTVSLSGARGLLSTSDGALVFTERDIISLSLVPLEEQIQALVRHDRVEEALLLLDGVQSHLPLDSYKELHKAITCLAGFIQFYQEAFSEARDLFIKGELDPKEIIRLYPGMASCLDEAFQSQPVQVRKARDLHELWQEDRSIFLHYLDFLGDFLRAIRGTEQGMKSSKEVDCALLRLYAEQGDTDNLEQLVASPNACRLDLCVPVLQQHKRFFALGSLYQSHRMQANAIKTWMKITDGQLDDPSCSDVYEHIVRTLSQLEDRDAVWTFADWTLQRNQEIGVQIFTKRSPDDQDTFRTDDVLSFLEKYPLGLLLYLEFLIHDLKSEEEKHHNLLALAYITQTLQSVQTEVESNIGAIRGKLRQLLWDSVYYDISTVYERVKSTALHTERAILLGRAGEYSQALQVLVHQERDPCAAEAFCCRASQGQGTQLRLTLLLTLLNIYLSSEDLTSAAVDLLNRNPHVFAPQTVLQLLPGSWSLQLVSQFLVGALRETSHQRRMGRLQRALAQAELLRHKVILAQASKTVFRVDKGQVCKVCKKDFTELQFVCNLRGELIHTSCSGYTAS
ncbi:transforming growth factor-beta receptor-associated protein 1 [Myripristis murdjan]|uniref:transforming growth factor-beta receptor-associated protein 1 n=1 Tax=Myripristis murdjan TaxID=586833 RepID=UPI0011761677|nr:transforming growth factor-beta receptor-associated protein 1-like [Myripristis murdjan]